MPDLNSFWTAGRTHRVAHPNHIGRTEDVVTAVWKLSKLVFSEPFRSNHLRSQFFDYTRTDMNRQ